jgi:hypothetical protein
VVKRLAEQIHNATGRKTLILDALLSETERHETELEKQDGITVFRANRARTEFSDDLLRDEKRIGLLSYVGGPIGRGVNLGEYSTLVVNSRTHAPTASIFIDTEFGSAEAQQEVKDIREARLINGVGRIMRADEKGEEGPLRRVVLVHNPDLVFDGAGWIPQPMPDAVVLALAGRTAPGNLVHCRWTHSRNTPWIVEQVIEWLRNGTVPPSRDPEPERRAKHSKKRGEAESEPEKRQRRRREVLDRLEALRCDGVNWTDARGSSGVKKPLQKWFDESERRALRWYYESGAVLEL